MSYTLIVCEGEHNERLLQKPTPKMIAQAIDDLTPAMYHFVILEAKPAIGKCAYMQTLIMDKGKAKGKYLVEARYNFPEGFKHYRKYVEDAGEVKILFRAFADGVAPNTAGWDDITDRMIALAG